MVGYNGDPQFDQFYPDMESLFPHSTIGAFKHLVGEYHTVSSFATWLGAQILKEQEIPETVILKNRSILKIETVLIYNHFNYLDHSFIVLKK